MRQQSRPPLRSLFDARAPSGLCTPKCCVSSERFAGESLQTGRIGSRHRCNHKKTDNCLHCIAHSVLMAPRLAVAFP
ncbi:hypothetical protein BSLA_02f2383 [Burkholderia stabilis]|nr:hypothetical protein BSLA_02f2383 [Burkholderia stabilis]